MSQTYNGTEALFDCQPYAMSHLETWYYLNHYNYFNKISNQKYVL